MKNLPEMNDFEDERDVIAKALADALGHGMREKCYHLADAVIAARAQTADMNDENGLPLGYAYWYNKKFLGRSVDTLRDLYCEDAWRAAVDFNSKRILSCIQK